MGMQHVSNGVRRTSRGHDTADPSFATTLGHGMALLEAFRGTSGALSNAELAARTGLSRPTVSRLTSTLGEMGYLRRGEGGRYLLGTRLLAVAYPLLAELRIRQLARPLMRDFAVYTGGTVSLAMPCGTEFVYVETVRMTEVAPHVPDIGFTSELATTAVGRALLSLYSEAELEAYLQTMEAEDSEAWPDRKAAILAGIEDCRGRGVCLSLGEWQPEIYGVAAPLYRSDDGECLAVNCGIPAFRFNRAEMESDCAPRMLALARSLRSLMRLG